MGRRRLGEAMAHNLSLVAGKATLGLLDEGGDGTGMLADAFLFGARNRADWASGMTILATLANVLPAIANGASPPAHAPTARAHHQTATIARRLHRKARIHQDDEAAEPLAAAE